MLVKGASLMRRECNDGRALAGYEKAFGRARASTRLDTIRELGYVYRSQGHLADAENLMRDYDLS